MTTSNDDVAKRANDLVKRIGAAHKASLHKVAQHLNMAKSAHAKGMSSLKKAAGCMVAAHKLGKAADSETLAGHMSDAHDHFNTSAEHMDDMEAHLGKAMSAWGHNTAVSSDIEIGGSASTPSLDEMTEGHVPQYDSAEPYDYAVDPSKFARVLKSLLGGDETKLDVVKGMFADVKKNSGVVTKADADKMVADAVAAATTKLQNEALVKQVESLSKTVEQLQRLPAGAPKVKIFDFEKSALPGMGGGEGDKSKAQLGALVDGVDFDISNEGDFQKAGGRMIANMIKNGPKFGGELFGKAPMYDPGFHGRGGTGARN